jgi:hypothetical protein
MSAGHFMDADILGRRHFMGANIFMGADISWARTF